MLADYDFEERLHQRITIREVAAGLSPRQRRLLHRYYRRGETYSEIGKLEGLSGARVNQIIRKSLGRLREQARRIPEPQAVKPQQATRNTPPVGFDKAAFLKHMRYLIKRRAETEERERQLEIAAKERAWQHEVATMDRFLELATPKPLPAPRPAPPAPQQRYEPPPRPPPIAELYWQYYSPAPQVSHYQLTVCAFNVLGEIARQRAPGVTQRGWVGQMTTGVKFRPNHSMKEAVLHMLRDVPSGAVLSTVALPIPQGMRGATAESEIAAVRVLISNDDQTLRFDVTWDHPPTD